MLFDHLRDLEYLDRNVVSAVKFNRTPAGKLTHLAIYIYIYIERERERIIYIHI